MLIFSGTSNPTLAKKITKDLNSGLSKLEIFKFPDKEVRVRVLENVLGKHAIVIQSTGVHPNHYYMQLFLILDSIKRSGGSTITLVIPYLGYQRQDHIFRSGEAVSLEVIVNLLKAMRVDWVISFDFHAPRISEFFRERKIKISELSALPVFVKEIEKMFARGPVEQHGGPTSSQASLDAGARRGSPALATPRFEDIVLVSPDMGGIRRIKQLAEMLGGNVSYISIEKDRDLNSGEVKSVKINGEVRKTAIIVDDVISTGKTLVSAAELLKKNGAKEIIVMATHGIFAGDAPQLLQRSVIDKVIVTDTIEVRSKRRFGKLQIISISSLIAEELAQK